MLDNKQNIRNKIVLYKPFRVRKTGIKYINFSNLNYQTRIGRSSLEEKRGMLSDNSTYVDLKITKTEK